MTELIAGTAVALGGGMLTAASVALARLQWASRPRHPVADAYPIVEADPALELLLDRIP